MRDGRKDSRRCNSKEESRVSYPMQVGRPDACKAQVLVRQRTTHAGSDQVSDVVSTRLSATVLLNLCL